MLNQGCEGDDAASNLWSAPEFLDVARMVANAMRVVETRDAQPRACPSARAE
jgi:hypothetical protein